MTHPNSNLTDVNADHAVSQTGEGTRASKPNDTVYQIAATVGAILLLVTIFWAG